MKALLFPRLNVVGHGNFLVYQYRVNSNNPKCIINFLTYLKWEYIKDSELIKKNLKTTTTIKKKPAKLLIKLYSTQVSNWDPMAKID